MENSVLTNKYYSKWLGIAEKDIECTGIQKVKSKERSVCQEGYSNPFALYMYITDANIIISYEESLEQKVNYLINDIRVGMSIEQIKGYIEDNLNVKPSHNIKFLFHELKGTDIEEVVQLQDENYRAYLDFFRANNPDCKDASWLQEYFQEIVAKKRCFGIFKDGKLVSATDAPSVPYMQKCVQEIGINTLTEYRGNGYAKKVCRASIQSLINNNICPLWSTAYKNIESEKLALSLGFKKLADVLTVSLD